ncbi:rod shape-determining protein MreD [Liquorilactobacillus capillatus]|uniref:Rod shape-determining protein MreD n=1 Tax=Liquorilactobacillus capillatus DSM 19910 TaxID=1423731 RepID=A0A0R1LWM5_9LACO|nr:rod shape-determining protein MreD [Liquorilactobacillus capillatus]KRL00087.1 rod shape-determining protein MreD [Liquorilactobacillus capillatus DSM 19910]
MRISKMRYFFPIGLFIALFLDGVLSQVFAGTMFTPSLAIESRIVLLWIVMAVCFGKIDHIILWTVLAGLVFDLYYTGIIGAFVVIMPLIVYLTKLMYRFFTPSFIVVLLIYLIDITVATVVFYWINLLIGFTNVSMAGFIGLSLGSTLAYNLAVFVLLYFPLQRFFESFSR